MFPKPHESPPIVQLENITKKFDTLIANDKVSLDIHPGEIVGLLGENGAGKTTLMNILYGLYQPDGGRILLNGSETIIQSPKASIEKGIGMVHQHFMLVKNFTVTENLALGLKDSNSPLLDLEYVKQKILELAKTYHIPVLPDAQVWQLSVGEQQRVEILNILLRKARVLIFDEPTAFLTPQESEDLFKTFKLLTSQGKAVIFITHKLDEALEITDRIVILRRGKVIDSIKTGSTNEKDIVRKMVGRDLLYDFPRKSDLEHFDLLTVEDLSVKNDRGLEAVKKINFCIKSGEILGIAGVDGNGQRELCEALAGMRKIESGKVIIKGKEFSYLDSRLALDQGLGFIPEDPQRTALLMEFSVWRNAILRRFREKQFGKHLFLDYKAIYSYTESLMKNFDIRVQNRNIQVRKLSGGNQQKIVLARELSADPDILVANQPTRGLDVGSIEYVHSQLIRQRNLGKAVLLISRELDEVLSVSDRVAVIHDGQIMGIFKADQADIEVIGALMIGMQP